MSDNEQSGDEGAQVPPQNNASAIAIPGMQPPPQLQTISPGSWKSSKQQWQNYSVVAEYRVALFLHVLGPRFLDTFNGFIFQSDADKHDIAKVIEKFDRYVIVEINESYERYIFNKRCQTFLKTVKNTSFFRALFIMLSYSAFLVHNCRMCNSNCSNTF